MGMWGVHAAIVPLVVIASAVAEAQDTPLAGTTLTILLTAPLSEPARATMVDEATAIWAREGVRLVWVRGGRASDVPSPSLRLLVLPKGTAEQTSDATSLVVGELVRPDEGRAVAIVSVTMAERIVRDAGPPRHPGARPDAERVGLVLGRAAAHEIGHYLLDTRTHVPRGLMRARFEMSEFVDARSEAFLLDPASALLLADRGRRTGITALTPLREAVGVSPAP